MELSGSTPIIHFAVINCENSKRWNPISFADMFKTLIGETQSILWTNFNVAIDGELSPVQIDDILQNYKGDILISVASFSS